MVINKINKIHDFAINEQYIKWSAHCMFFVHKSRILNYPFFYINLFDEVKLIIILKEVGMYFW
jgi:hypothetical protein